MNNLLQSIVVGIIIGYAARSIWARAKDLDHECSKDIYYHDCPQLDTNESSEQDEISKMILDTCCDNELVKAQQIIRQAGYIGKKR